MRPGEQSFYWEQSDGKKCLRVVYKDGSQEVIGFNFFGIRALQKVCERWILDKRTIDYVLEHLPEANFDPEFFKHHEQEIIEAYNKQNGAALRLKPKQGFLSRFLYQTNSNPNVRSRA